MTLLLTLLLKSLLLFAVSSLLLFALRRSSAAARSLVCLLTLGAVLALPLCSAVLPGWQVLPEHTPVRSSPALPVREGEELKHSAAVAGSSAGAISAPPALPASTAPSSSSLTGRTPAKQGGGFLFFLLGLLLASVRPLLGLWGIRRLSRQCVTVTDPQTLTLAADCAHLLGLQAPLRLCVAATVPVPMTWGWRRPVVVLPPLSADWPEDRLRSVLLHEMAHIKRRDWPAHRFADLACAVYWFHPLVWLTARRLRVETELACDDLVLSSGIPASDYARHLLEIASALPRVSGRSHTAIAMAQTSKIESRLQMILDKTRPRRPLARRVLVLALIPASAALITLAILKPDAKAQTSPKSADLSSQPALHLLWPGGSAGRGYLKPGSGLTWTVQPDLMTTTDLKINGTTLFAGVTDANKPASPWWSATGAVLPKPVYDTTHTEDSIGTPKTRNVRFAFRLPATAQGVTFQYNLLRSIGSSSSGTWPGKTQNDAGRTEAQMFTDTSGLRIVLAAFPLTLKKTNVQIGIGSGAWKVAASAAATTSIASNLSSSGFVIGHTLETKDGLSLIVSTDTTDDIRVVAVNLQGQEILPNSIGGQSVNKLGQITAQFNLPLSQVKEFRVETRQFQWVEYKDVALRPVQ